MIRGGGETGRVRSSAASDVYKRQAVVADYYAKDNKHIKIDGVGTVDEITQRLFSAIDNAK